MPVFIRPGPAASSLRKPPWEAPLLIAFLADVPRLKDDKSVSQG